MNYKMVGRFMFLIIITEAIFMVPAWLISLVSGEDASASAFAITIVGAMVVGLLGLMWCRKAERHFYAREGLVSAGLGCNESGGMYPFYAVRGDTDVY